MRKSRTPSALAAAMLAMEAQQVIALRLMRLAVGAPGAKRELRRMVTEKVDATHKALGLIAKATTRGAPDGGADAVVRMLRRRVRANRARLTGIG